MTGLRKEFPRISVKTLCGLFGMTPQAYYKKKKTLVSRRQIQDTMLSFVQYYRSKDPGIGGLKLYNELCSVYHAASQKAAAYDGFQPSVQEISESDKRHNGTIPEPYLGERYHLYLD